MYLLFEFIIYDNRLTLECIDQVKQWDDIYVKLARLKHKYSVGMDGFKVYSMALVNKMPGLSFVQVEHYALRGFNDIKFGFFCISDNGLKNWLNNREHVEGEESWRSPMFMLNFSS